MNTIQKLRRELNNQKLDYNFLIFFALYFGLFFGFCVIGFFSTKKAIKTYSQLIEKSQKEFGEKNENHRI